MEKKRKGRYISQLGASDSVDAIGRVRPIHDDGKRPRDAYSADPGLPGRIADCAGRLDTTELAKITGIPSTNLGEYMRGVTEPKVGAVVRIADATGVTIEWLAAGRGPMLLQEVPAFYRVGVDRQLLAQVIQAQEDAAENGRLVLTSAARAETAALVYAMVVDAPRLQPQEELSKLMASIMAIGKGVR